jgi:hypothetical protein
MLPKEKPLNKPFIVWLILNQRTEDALNQLAEHYKVNVPNLKVGLPKGRKKNILGCYQPKNETISVYNSDVFGNPFVILHEFYHHLRSKAVDKQHRGTERNADMFANEFLKEYNAAAQTSAANLGRQPQP